MSNAVEDASGEAEKMPDTADLEEPSTEKEPGEEPRAEKPKDTEPSHEAVGIGVVGAPLVTPPEQAHESSGA